MKISDYLDMAKLEQHLKDRVVNVQHHRYAPLDIYNYGQKAQFESIWDDVTCKTRGLIVNRDTGVIVARPFEKFFNLGHNGRPETDPANLPAELPEITDKLDGSLGILYRIGTTPAISTRGSFESDQAAWASSWFKKNLSHIVWPPDKTFLFEIIYPDNRIVVKYDTEGLFLLGAVDIETGEETPYNTLKWWADVAQCPVVRKTDISLTECRAENTSNAEGYVATWHKPGKSPLKVKIKFVDYIRLHRLLTSISPKAIWEMLAAGQSFEELLVDTPTHYVEWVNYWKNGLQAEYGRFEQKAIAAWESCSLLKDGKDKEARKALAEYFTAGDRKPISSILFKMLDGQSYNDVIWKLVKDRTRDQEPFKRDIE